MSYWEPDPTWTKEDREAFEATREMYIISEGRRNFQDIFTDLRDLKKGIVKQGPAPSKPSNYYNWAQTTRYFID